MNGIHPEERVRNHYHHRCKEEDKRRKDPYKKILVTIGSFFVFCFPSLYDFYQQGVFSGEAAPTEITITTFHKGLKNEPLENVFVCPDGRWKEVDWNGTIWQVARGPDGYLNYSITAWDSAAGCKPHLVRKKLHK